MPPYGGNALYSLENHIAQSLTARLAPEVAERFAPTLLAKIAAAMMHYEEESRKCLPVVHIFEDFNALKGALPYLERYELEVADSFTPEFALKVLKRSAPLVDDDWHIYFDKSDGRVHAGVFRGALKITSVGVEETLDEVVDASSGYARISCRSHASVLIKVLGLDLLFSLKHVEGQSIGLDHVTSMVELISQAAKTPSPVALKTFLRRLLRSALTSSHGALIAVLNDEGLPAYFTKSVRLTPPVDFSPHVSDTEGSEAVLSGLAHLATHLIHSDGVTVFAPTGKLLAYRCFTPDPRDHGPAAAKGARHTAYQSLKEQVEHGALSGALIQSQDGDQDSCRKQN